MRRSLGLVRARPITSPIRSRGELYGGALTSPNKGVRIVPLNCGFRVRHRDRGRAPTTDLADPARHGSSVRWHLRPRTRRRPMALFVRSRRLLPCRRVELAMADVVDD